MKRIGIATSGGDASGMNAAILAATKTAMTAGLEVFAVRRGYRGLIDGEIVPIEADDVANILPLGGTILETSRTEEFKEEAAQQRSIENLKTAGVEALIVIGGDGSQRGAAELSTLGFPVIGIASTIDNDVYGCDVTIGADTALNAIIELVDRLRVSADSHHRAFLIEVDGRGHGYLALMSSIAAGADAVVTPEFDAEPSEVATRIDEIHRSGKKSALVVVTRAARGNAQSVADYLDGRDEQPGYELRVTILNHVQRGGPPTAADRLLATQLGAAAVKLALAGDFGKLVGWRDGRVAHTPLADAAANQKDVDVEMLDLGKILST